MAARVKKAKRSNGDVTYVRLRPELRERIAQIVSTRGWPHTIASVTAELVEKGLTS